MTISKRRWMGKGQGPEDVLRREFEDHLLCKWHLHQIRHPCLPGLGRRLIRSAVEAGRR